MALLVPPERLLLAVSPASRGRASRPRRAHQGSVGRCVSGQSRAGSGAGAWAPKQTLETLGTGGALGRDPRPTLSPRPASKSVRCLGQSRPGRRLCLASISRLLGACQALTLTAEGRKNRPSLHVSAR